MKILLVVIGVILIFIGLGIAAYGLWITRPETGMAIEVYIGAAFGLLGLFIAGLGGYRE